MVARGELPPDFTARLTVARRTASARAASTSSPVRPQVACDGAVEQLAQAPASTVIPRFAASSARLAARTTGRPRSRHARARGRCRARLPASTTMRIASGAASRRYIQNGSSPAGSSSSDRVPGRSTSHASRPPDRDPASLEARRSCRGHWRSRRSGDWRWRGTWTCRRWGDRPWPRRAPVWPVVRTATCGRGVAGRSRHEAGPSDAARGRVCTCAATLVESASRARPSSTTRGPPSGVRAATTTRRCREDALKLQLRSTGAVDAR